MYQWEGRKCGAAGAVVWASKAPAVECSCAKMFKSFLLAVSKFQLSLFTSLPLIVICTIQDTRTGRIHLLYTYTWYLYLQYTCMQGMWAPHTVCTFARCPLLSTDLLRIENKTLALDQISISMKTLWKPPYMYNVFMYVLPLLL